VIEVHLDLGGFPVTLIDTAGLRETDDPIEREGISRARRRAARADLRLLLDAVTAEGAAPPAVEGEAAAAPEIRVLNKIDLLSPALTLPAGTMAISAATGAGIEALEHCLERAVARLVEGDGGGRQPVPAEAPPLTQHRHREALERCAGALARAIAMARTDISAVELVAEDVRIAARELGRITGRVDVEDILDIVFRDFCIGK